MGVQHQYKLNWLQRALPEGLVADSVWLEKHGYSRSLRQKYVAHGWLDQMARGVYRRPVPKPPANAGHEALRWQPVVISLQTLLDCPFTVGGRTALELQGFAHYLSSSGHYREVHLYGPGKPPGWVFKLELDNPFVFHNAEKLFKTGNRASAQERNPERFRQLSSEKQLHSATVGSMGMATDHVVAGASDS